MKKISGDLDRDPINPRWATDGSGVFFDAQDRGSQNDLFRIRPRAVRRSS